MENRKVKITKNIFKETLVKELLTTPLSSVSVTSLCAKADLNRSTFYAHYEDLNALFCEIEDEFLSHFVFLNSAPNKTKLYQRVIEFVLYVQKNQDTFFALIRNGALISKFTKQSIEYAKSQHPQESDIPVLTKLMTAYTVSGTISLLREWLENPAGAAPDIVAGLIINFSLYADKTTLKKV